MSEHATCPRCSPAPEPLSADEEQAVRERAKVLRPVVRIIHNGEERVTDEAMMVRALERALATLDLQRERVASLAGAMRAAAKLLRLPPSGTHRCRFCEASTSNGWTHAESCSYRRWSNEVGDARAILEAALSIL
jgi:hypothetical protein